MLVLATRRIADENLDTLALIGLVVVVGAVILLSLVLRSPEGATRVGALLGRFIHWVAGLFRKELATDFGELAAEFREQSAEVLKSRWRIGLASGSAAQIASFVVLFLSIRFVGIGSDDLHWSVAFGAFSVVRISSMRFGGGCHRCSEPEWPAQEGTRRPTLDPAALSRPLGE